MTTYAIIVERRRIMASRARSVSINDQTLWFDMKLAHLKATDKQIELLATIEDLEMDDLLESNVTQGDVLKRLREALGQAPIPPDVLLKRQKWRRERQTQPPCRLCHKIGDSTRHHFVNKWILKELSGYGREWSNRQENCIPLCIDCHRDLHDRSGPSKSIAHVLTAREKDFANRAIERLSEERPKLLILIAKGSDTVYEARLIKDWFEGLFEVEAAELAEDEPLAAVA
jgi:hypothetical protein